jgi:hypothetical protein
VSEQHPAVGSPAGLPPPGGMWRGPQPTRLLLLRPPSLQLDTGDGATGGGIAGQYAGRRAGRPAGRAGGQGGSTWRMLPAGACEWAWRPAGWGDARGQQGSSRPPQWRPSTRCLAVQRSSTPLLTALCPRRRSRKPSHRQKSIWRGRY